LHSTVAEVFPAFPARVAESRRLTILYRLRKNSYQRFRILYYQTCSITLLLKYLSFRDETLLVFKSELFLISVLMRFKNILFFLKFLNQEDLLLLLFAPQFSQCTNQTSTYQNSSSISGYLQSVLLFMAVTVARLSALELFASPGPLICFGITILSIT